MDIAGRRGLTLSYSRPKVNDVVAMLAVTLKRRMKITKQSLNMTRKQHRTKMHGRDGLSQTIGWMAGRKLKDTESLRERQALYVQRTGEIGRATEEMNNAARTRPKFKTC